MRKLLLILLLLSTSAYGQFGSKRVRVDTLVSFTPGQYVFLRDSIAIGKQIRLDSIPTPTTPPSASLHLYSRALAGLFIKRANGTIWRLDTNYAGIFEPVITPSNTVKQYWNGFKQFVTLNTDSIVEGSTNLFFTNARARSAISANAPITYNSGTGVIGVDTSTALTGLLTIHRLSDSTSVLRTDLKRKDDSTNAVTGYTTLYQNSLKKDKTDSTANTGYLPVHRLADSTAQLRTDLVPKTRNVNTQAPLTGGGSLASDLTLIADTSAGNTHLASQAFVKNQTGGVTGLANPTQSIDLSTHNGSATTAMRSDAAPALSQSIAPTWTATHIFQKNILNEGVDSVIGHVTTATNKNLNISSIQQAVDTSSFYDTLSHGTGKHSIGVRSPTGALTLGVDTAGLVTVSNRVTGLTQATTSTDAVAGGRAINTNSPITGGGNLTADRTLSADTTILATKTDTSTARTYSDSRYALKTRAINTTAPLTGGGDLSADRTLVADTTAGNTHLASQAFVKNQTGGITGLANPSASIGLSAVNGSATTAIRSDGAPALSQSIAPTWSGTHIWQKNMLSEGTDSLIGFVNTATNKNINVSSIKQAVDTSAFYDTLSHGTGKHSVGVNGAAGESVFRIDTSYNVGIGTSPSTILHVRKDQNAATVFRVENATNNTSAEADIQSKNDLGHLGQFMIYSSGTSAFGALSSDNGALYSDAAALVLMVNNGSGVLKIATGGNSERARIDASGNLGLGTTSPTNMLSLSGQSARTIWLERNTTSNTAGNNLTVQSSGATSGATDKAGGSLILSPGASTGTGIAHVNIEGYTLANSTGTSDNTQLDREIIGNVKSVGNNSTTSLFSINPAANTHDSYGFSVEYMVEVTDGTNSQSETGYVQFASYSTGSSTDFIQTGTPTKTQALSSGTLTVTWSGSTGGSPRQQFRVNANSSLTPSTGYPKVTFTIKNFSAQAITLQ